MFKPHIRAKLRNRYPSVIVYLNVAFAQRHIFLRRPILRRCLPLAVLYHFAEQSEHRTRHKEAVLLISQTDKLAESFLYYIGAGRFVYRLSAAERHAFQKTVRHAPRNIYPYVIPRLLFVRFVINLFLARNQKRVAARQPICLSVAYHLAPAADYIMYKIAVRIPHRVAVSRRALHIVHAEHRHIFTYKAHICHVAHLQFQAVFFKFIIQHKGI